MRIAAETILAVFLATWLAAEAAFGQVTPNQPATLTLTREIRIDGVSEDLVNVGWVRVAPNGRIAFSQHQDMLVRFYDASGKLIGKFGRAGDGPGEFRNLIQAGWFGDSLWVHDFTTARITIIPPSLGEPRTQASIRAFIKSANPKLPQLTFARILGISRSRDILLDGMFFPDSVMRVLPPYAQELQTGFVRAGPTGGFVDFLGGVRADPNRSVRIAQGLFVPVPFVERNVTGGAHDGSRAVIVLPVVDGRDAGTFTATAIGLRRDTIFSRRHQFPLERIPPAAFSAAVEERVKSFSSVRDSRGVSNFNPAAYRAGAKSPPAYPPFSSVMVGRDGSIWLRGRATPAERTYLVLDSRGELFGQFVLKADIRIAEADLNNIWAVEKDADGIESVVRYRVARAR